ncbi:hypothetical protein [Conchiformibius kuhniae]|uniref:Uncharacterized protein n=1 Tax=Conchiformibius kuhniae TaxID=211502 RepID=A0A8T9MSJ9_9NEIS|nr:hypothetical protein [Conchiformibius kuhniae]UOP04870.1 hypothetical protein LVJ77_00370 [Conchiformibius kuhniae]
MIDEIATDTIAENLKYERELAEVALELGYYPDIRTVCLYYPEALVMLIKDYFYDDIYEAFLNAKDEDWLFIINSHDYVDIKDGVITLSGLGWHYPKS